MELQKVDVDRLRTHITELSRSSRPAESTALEEARVYVAACLSDALWSVSRHGFESESDEGIRLSGINLIAEPADRPLTDAPRFCVAAHVDSRPDSPGADDNASAVATLLEIARVLPKAWPDDSMLQLELLVTDLEENGMLGAAEHARLTKANNIDLRGMVSLEMLGYCDHSAGSQSLPHSLVGLYPDTANFIAVIGNQNSDRLIESFRIGMERVDNLPVETLAVPANGVYLQATRLSDHSPFWDAGYPALMITDTSFMRNPHYHMPSDTIDTLDMQFLESVAQGCLEAVRHVVAEGF